MALISFHYHFHGLGGSVVKPALELAPQCERKPRGVFERPRGSGCWWIRFWRDGQEYRRKIGALEKAIAAYKREKQGFGVHSMCGLIDDYLAARPELVSHSHESHGRHFREWFRGQTIQEAAEGLESWRAARLRQVSASTVRHQMFFLTKLFERAVKHGLLARNPIGREGMKPPRANPPKARVLGAEEETRLLAVGNEDDRDHIRFLLLTGLRRGELAALRWEDIRAETLLVKRGGRTGKSRSLWLRPEAREILDRRRQDELTAPFPNAMNWCISRLYTLVRRAKLTEVSAHVLRHSFATRLIESTGDLMAAHHALGHSSLDMTKRYINLTSAHLRGALERADNL